nr:VanW family protein [Mesobacillus boroniphilus]
MEKLDLENLKTELLAAGQEFASTTEISLEKYLPAEDPVIISTASIKLSAEDNEIQELAESFNAIEISPKTPFSFAAFVEEAGQHEGSSAAFSQIASALYRAILPTNLTITERHISRQLPKNVELGYEAKVDFAKNIDLKLYNPNETAYQIVFDIVGRELQVSVKGAPLLYDYKITSTNKQEFKPRTIKQYSALLKQGQKSVEQEGAPGLLVTMNREIYGEDGGFLKTELLSEDFYPPVHRIEILPVAPAVQQTPPAPTGNLDTVTTPGENQNTSIPGQPGGTTPPPAYADNSEETTNDEQNTDDGSLWGKPDEQPK